ncbi:MAG: hypothetical protein H6608_07030 [Flavobacteriales bacterium]|nr:hypothetical protein [Bacteroidota bacterium]MCB9240865.1 hypothetical protein [Flavobacteriales bacterium]
MSGDGGNAAFKLCRLPRQIILAVLLGITNFIVPLVLGIGIAYAFSLAPEGMLIGVILGWFAMNFTFFKKCLRTRGLFSLVLAMIVWGAVFMLTIRIVHTNTTHLILFSLIPGDSRFFSILRFQLVFVVCNFILWIALIIGSNWFYGKK